MLFVVRAALKLPDPVHIQVVTRYKNKLIKLPLGVIAK